MKLFLLSIITCLGIAQISSQPSQSSVRRVGHVIRASTRGADWDRTAFLLHETALADGVVFAFSAYFRNQNKVYFQIWRPVSSVSRTNFTLIHEWPFYPAVSGGREDIYVQTRQDFNCIRVKKDDRLGLYFEEAPGSVAYTFDPSGPQTYQFVLAGNETKPARGSSVVFDTLVYPYSFSAAAYVDTDMSKYTVGASGEVSCPTKLSIPIEMPTTGPAGSVGATGWTGPIGPMGATGAMGNIGPPGVPGVRGEQGLMGLHGATGASGPQGNMGATGERGPAGENGQEGAPGSAGPAGPPGPAGKDGGGPNAIEALISECKWCKNLLNPYVILGLIIWLTLVTLLLVIFICCVSCRRRNNAKYKEKKWTGSQHDLWKKYEGANGTAAQVPSYENPAMEPTYDAIEEGRTAF